MRIYWEIQSKAKCLKFASFVQGGIKTICSLLNEKSSATEAASIGHHRDKTNHENLSSCLSSDLLTITLIVGLDHIPELIVKKFAETDFKMQLVIIVLLTNLGGFLNAFCMKRGRKLSLRQQLIAIHPKIREVNDGNILSVEHDSCRVQFDSPELGVEHVTVSSVLHNLRQRDAYPANQKSPTNSNFIGGLASSLVSQESDTTAGEIAEG
ncbi:hypothetical protein V6N13_060976 [Hibiscus sabdariffa]